MGTLAPVILDSGTISLSATNSTRAPTDTSRLTMDGPWWLDEIIFDLGAAGLGSDIWVKLQIGEIPITKDFVPIRMLTERPNANESSTYKWRLPKPIYVPPLVYVQPTFFYNNQVAAGGAASVAVTYWGRRVNQAVPVPASVWMPYAAAFVGATITSGTLIAQQSTEYDLANPFTQPLTVDYVTSDINSDLLLNPPTPDSIDSDDIYTNCFLRIVDSNSRIVVRDRTILGAVFPPTTKAWRTRGVQMPPRGYYLAYVEADYAETNASRILIGLIGRRPVAVELIHNTSR